jgi:tight adherence protein B
MNGWIPALMVFVAVASGTVALVLVVESVRVWRRRRQVQRRVDHVLEQGDGSGHGPARASLFQAEDREPSVLEALVARVPQFADLPALLEASGVSWSVQTFVLLTIGSAAGVFLAGMALGRGVIIAAILAAVTAWAPYVSLRVRRARRITRFEEGFPEAIDMLGRAIRAGHPLSAGIQMVGQEMGDPVGGEFRRLFEQQRFGVPFAEALMGLVDRVDLVDVRIFATAVLVQREVGGNLAEILDNISAMIRSRFKIRRQLRTYTAQGRMSGMVVGVMPIVVGAAFYVLNPDYIMLLFRHPMGRLMLIGAITLQIFGYLWIRKVVTIEI